jgi:hypothetical protein
MSGIVMESIAAAISQHRNSRVEQFPTVTDICDGWAAIRGNCK